MRKKGKTIKVWVRVRPDGIVKYHLNALTLCVYDSESIATQFGTGDVVVATLKLPSAKRPKPTTNKLI